MEDLEKSEVLVIYDGACPVCTKYCHRLRISRDAGELRLIDARGSDPELTRIREAGFDLNRGIVVETAGKTSQGSDAVHLLGIMSCGGTFVSAATRIAFRSKHFSKLLYPLLKLIRRAILFVTGKKEIGNG